MSTKINPILIDPAGAANGAALVYNSANGVAWGAPVSAGGGGVTSYETLAELPLSGNSSGDMAYVEENNRLYLWTGVGWFNIALINTNPTITSGPNALYALSIDGTPTVLTLVASDPEGLPITWSYQVTSGTLGDTAVITQDGNEFTITPSTDTADVGSFQITFTASDGVNLATAASNFSLVFVAADAYYNQSIVLTTGSINNGNNNTFIDSSNNNFTITRNGNATQGTFSPVSPAGWSGYFDGTGDFLDIPTSAASLGAGNFTIELWLYPQSAASLAVFDSRGSSTSGDGWLLHYSAAGTFTFLNDGSLIIQSTIAAPLNVWTHIAICRVGNTVTFYTNGVSSGTATHTSDMAPNSLFYVGIKSLSTSSNVPFLGHISNIRLVNGTALYTANFTPPTEPLTAVSGTSLLTLQDNRFIDRSTNNFTITKNGDVRVTPFAPFVPTVSYDISTHGGSAYFDGTGDSLNLGTDVNNFIGDVTIECWVYPAAVGTGGRQWLFGSSDNAAGIHAVNISSANGTLELWLGSYSFASRSTTIQIVAGAWNHIALVESAGAVSLYINGVSAVSPVTGVQWGRGSTLWLSTYPGENTQFFRGYISGYRYVTGTALYTSNFTPPAAPLTPITNTYRLLNFTNSNIFDETGKVVVETVGDAKVSTGVVKYGNSSMAFDGSGDYLLIPNSPEIDLGTGNFTIEMWLNLANVASDWQTIISRAYTVAGGWRLYKTTSANELRWYVGSSLVVTTTQGHLSNNTWAHVAVVRNNGVATVYINGVSRGSASDTTNLTPGNYAIEIGGGVQGGSYPMNGYISDLRITKGHARYTANFTPPAAKLGYYNAE